jgi:hypothetical protein
VDADRSDKRPADTGRNVHGAKEGLAIGGSHVGRVARAAMTLRRTIGCTSLVAMTDRAPAILEYIAFQLDRLKMQAVSDQ